MIAAAEALGRSALLLSLLSTVSSLLVTAGCALLADRLFRVEVRRSVPAWVVCAALNVAFGALSPIADANLGDALQVAVSAVGVVLPFASMALLFKGKGLWKTMLVPAGYGFVDAASFIILLIFFDFDYAARNEALELLVGLPVNLIFFGVSLFLFLRGLRRRTVVADLTNTGVILYLLIVLSTSVFVATLLVIGPVVSDRNGLEFALLLLNVPLISATAAFALIRYFRIRNEAENYRKQLRMQILQFERMERMMEDVRIFRHDFPKKMRPLVAYLDADRTEEARLVAEQFTDFAARVGERFHTGSFRLDTVLSFEQQLAERDGITIDVPFDTAFPAEGVDPDDIYTIFPNALDNAIEACRGVPEDRRKIEFRSRMDAQSVFVTIRNPFSGQIKTKDGLPQTIKSDGAAHGYGLRSIKRAAAGYGDDNVTFLVEDGVFELRLFLNYRKT